MAAADALLGALRVPRQVIVDDDAAELQVNAFRSGFCTDEDAGFVFEFFYYGCFDVCSTGTRNGAVICMTLFPATINFFGNAVVVYPIEKYDFSFIAIMGGGD